MGQARYRVYVCGGPHCGARGPALLAALEQAIAEQGLEDTASVLIGGCLSRCERGPNLIVHPGGVVYVGLDAAAAREIVAGHLAQGQVVEARRDSAPHR
jgi:NADP-reducing hydrogenase subunit HndC